MSIVSFPSFHLLFLHHILPSVMLYIEKLNQTMSSVFCSFYIKAKLILLLMYMAGLYNVNITQLNKVNITQLYENNIAQLYRGLFSLAQALDI